LEFIWKLKMITKYSGDACSLWPNGEVRYLDPSTLHNLTICNNKNCLPVQLGNSGVLDVVQNLPHVKFGRIFLPPPQNTRQVVSGPQRYNGDGGLRLQLSNHNLI
jgi:hypothetical protein